MFERQSKVVMLCAVTATFLLATMSPQQSLAQKIICWKDSAGKVIGCGDRVPPEFQKSETKQLDSQGITRGTKVSAEEAARLRAEAEKKAALKAEDDRRLAEQRRQDSALINTYTSDKEIDQRRDRELQVIDLQIVQLKVSLKSATDAHAATQKRHEAATKSGKPVPQNLQDEMTRATDDKKRLETRVAEREKDKEIINKRYADQKARYLELKNSGATQSAAPAPSPAKK